MGKLRSVRPYKKKSQLQPAGKIDDPRFGCLLAWLMFVLFLCIVSLVSNIINFGPRMQMLKAFSGLVSYGGGGSTIQPWMLPVSMMLNVIRILFALALLFRQKWGLYGLIGLHLAAFIMEIAIGWFGFGSVIRLLVVPGVAAVLAVTVWQYLE